MAGPVGTARGPGRIERWSVLLGRVQVCPIAARCFGSAGRGGGTALGRPVATTEGADVITSARYLSRTFLSRFGLLLLAFVVLFEIFDMMATGDQVISRNNSILALFRYSALRIPEIMVQSLPFSVLLAALLTLAGLAQNNEIVVLNSIGISFF